MVTSTNHSNRRDELPEAMKVGQWHVPTEKVLEALGVAQWGSFTVVTKG